MTYNDDLYFRQISVKIDDVDLVSLDVFDTLLMRTCRSPEDVFAMAAARAAEEVDFSYSPATYKAIRTEAETRARRKRLLSGFSPECTISDIFEELPFSAETQAVLRNAEFRCEKEVLFLNECAVSFLQHCKRMRKKTILTSNMYYSGKEVLELLVSAGFEPELSDGIFVSSDYGKNKADGSLFSEIIASFPEIPPHRILHIGDSEKSDVLGASLAGISSFGYMAIPREFGSIYDLEGFFGGAPGEISSLRRLAAASAFDGFTERETLFFRTGAEIIGPLCVLYAEWVVNFAIVKGIEVILPLMREGELLSELIGEVIKRRGLNISCEPFYSSRHSLFAASIFPENIGEKISRALIKSGVVLKTALSDIGIDLSGTELDGFKSKTIGEIKSENLLDAVYAFLQKQETRNKILAYAKEQRVLFLRYLRSKLRGSRAVTVDIGMKGTAERLFREILEKTAPDIELYSTLLMGSDKNNVDNILDGVKIFSWLGFAGENTDAIARLFYQASIIEILVSATCGTVLRYEVRGNETFPVLDRNMPEETGNNLPAVSACRKGIFAFQKLWFKLVEKKPMLNELLKKKRELINIWRRLVEMPTPEEAVNIGGLVHYDRYSWEKPFPLCGLELSSEISDLDIEKLLSGYKKSDSEWPQAAVAIARPDYFAGLFIKSYSEIPFMNAMYGVAREILADKAIQSVVIYAASQRGRDFYSVAKLLGVPIKCFTDSNRKLHGMFIDGLEIVSPDKLGIEVDAFVVASFLYSDEICRDIQSRYMIFAKTPKIFAF